MKHFGRPIATALVVLLMCGLQASNASTQADNSARDITAELEGVTGMGWRKALAVIGCSGCVVGAVHIISGGWGAMLVALSHRRSIAVASACIGACRYVFAEDLLH